MKQSDRFKLYFGPYKTPRFKYGKKVWCEYRGWVRIVGLTDGQIPWRWIVECTFAWLARYRRHSKDYKKTTASSEALTYISMIALMSQRLANAENRISKHVLRTQ